MGISAVVELCGISSLAFAVGAYLPLSSTTPIFIGGMVKWLADKITKRKGEESDIGSGALFSSGLIAGGSLTGILIAFLTAKTIQGADGEVSLMAWLNSGVAEGMGTYADLVAMIMFLLLGALLLRFAVMKEKQST